MSFPWNADGVEERLKKLWTEDGLSLAMIAADLSAFAGVPVTRNAVIGRVTRLGLVKGKPAEGGDASASPISDNSALVEPVASILPADPKPEPLAPAVPVQVAPPPSPAMLRSHGGVALTDLRVGQCRFPVTPHHAPTHFFCADPIEAPGATYCPTHAAVCFDRRSQQERRSDQERAARARAGKEAA